MTFKANSAKSAIISSDDVKSAGAISMDNRFVLIKGKDLEDLVNILNKCSEDTWFSIVKIEGSLAVVDLAVHPVTAVDPGELEGETDNAFHGNDNSFNKNLIA